MKSYRCILAAVAAAFLAGCDKPVPSGAGAPPPKHEHVPPHGGTPVELGKEEFHIELVRDAAAGKLTAYVMDGELETFVRIAGPSLELVAALPGGPEKLLLRAVPNPATGETVGDTAQFEAEAPWIKDRAVFDAAFPMLKIRGRSFTNVQFNFPKGNDEAK